ncbi:hypothetical protein [Limosilactobacillus mucosae]|jgi:hypothetical protein|uniref:hypothetical protein n=1 Tax=Limosilactobacillus mucosae TaxID=97478 RepID=UPI002432220C|nr:hypothetical protein [Limosilactobacillus mucosae]MCI1490344.1 hypothetical protein [Limosilactobacillus mucosae]MCI1525713.1 hypothetical protein [Limosilactobacillus mucosae]MDM8220316.1 hypothetical protein [Limosilactobacillus mucosae]
MTTSKIAIKIDEKIYEKISTAAKQNHVNKTEMLELIVENYFHDQTIERGNAELKSIIREYNDNLAAISENLKKLAGDSETTKNYIRMFFEELTGVYDPDDLDGNDFKN